VPESVSVPVPIFFRARTPLPESVITPEKLPAPTLMIELAVELDTMPDPVRFWSVGF
jgi:hypothetical protein